MGRISWQRASWSAAWLVVTLVAVVWAGVDRFVLPELEKLPPVLEDQTTIACCFTSVNVRAFVDADGDGVWNPGEEPVEGVGLLRVGKRTPYLTRSPDRRTDASGHAELFVGGSCDPSRRKFDIAAVPPEGFELVSPRYLEGRESVEFRLRRRSPANEE